ncbi:MAG: glycosyltransferase family 2 protein [Gammaproteobacteria bacterium]|nr:glycosyltransferase family 2 protein [Gammaproteobacteria bacterium]
MPDAISIVIPAYNEGQSVADTLSELDTMLTQHGIEAEIIIVDDGSTDNTSELALKSGARVFRHHNNRGYGASLKTGITAASNKIIAMTDADGTYPFRYIPEMVEALKDTDMVVGARIGENVHIPWIRRPAKWLLNKLANYVSGHKIPDINSGLRVFRKDTVIHYFPILPNKFSWTTTITLALLCDDYSIKYIPIDYRQRTGKSKIVPWDAGTFTILILRMAILFRPLRVFLPLMLACFTYAVIKMVIDLAVIGDRNISATAVMMFISALIILLMGMVADALITRLGRIAPEGPASAVATENMEMTLDKEKSRQAGEST